MFLLRRQETPSRAVPPTARTPYAGLTASRMEPSARIFTTKPKEQSPVLRNRSLFLARQPESAVPTKTIWSSGSISNRTTAGLAVTADVEGDCLAPEFSVRDWTVWESCELPAPSMLRNSWLIICTAASSASSPLCANGVAFGDDVEAFAVAAVI